MPADPRFDGAGPDAQWRDQLAAGRFTIQTCPSCATVQFPPSVACRDCGAPAGPLTPASGRGTVYSTTTVRKRDGAYNVAIIALDEGPRLMTRVSGDPEAVAIDMAVRARIERSERDETPVLVFDPEAEA